MSVLSASWPVVPSVPHLKRRKAMARLTSNLVTGGVDTHEATPVPGVVDDLARVVAAESFPAVPAGYRSLLALSGSTGGASLGRILSRPACWAAAAGGRRPTCGVAAARSRRRC